MPWLLRDGEVLAAVEVAHSRHERRRLSRDGIDGALVFDPGKAVHTVRMRHPVDVAFCGGGDDGTLVVLATVGMPRWRVGRPRLKARCVIAAELGAFERWHLAAGDVLQIS